MPDRMVGDAGEQAGKIELGVAAVELAISIRGYIAAARRPPTSEPAKR